MASAIRVRLSGRNAKPASNVNGNEVFVVSYDGAKNVYHGDIFGGCSFYHRGFDVIHRRSEKEAANRKNFLSSQVV